LGGDAFAVTLFQRCAGMATAAGSCRRAGYGLPKRLQHPKGMDMRCTPVLAGLVLLTQGALAEPTRDEVMSGAARCAGIADNRTWLDCFYGSAQPMRTILGLTPAPPGQVKLVPPPGAGYLSPEAPRSPATSVPAPEKSRGFLADLLGSPKPIAANVPMTSYKFGRDGKFTVVLRNGETYRQEESDVVTAGWNRPASTYLVTIVAAADKFILKVKGEPGVIFHVRRV
jgi:hypothetical protein